MRTNGDVRRTFAAGLCTAAARRDTDDRVAQRRALNMVSEEEAGRNRGENGVKRVQNALNLPRGAWFQPQPDGDPPCGLLWEL